MWKRETKPMASTKATRIGAPTPRPRSDTKGARAAYPEAGCESEPSHADQQEAWGIAADLIADLGGRDAVAWASDYMLGLHDKGDWRGMQRWGMVASALDELAVAKVQ